MIKYFYLLLFFTTTLFAQINLGVIQDTSKISEIKAESILCDINYIPQEKNLCVAASAEMVLDFYGKRISQKDIKRLVDNKNYKDTDNRLYSFVYFNELVNTLAKIGFNWEVKRFPIRDFNKGMDFIINELSNNRPLLVCVSRLYATEHTVVLNGYSEKDKIIIITDPMLQAPGIRIISLDEFKRIWIAKNNRFLVKT